MPTLGPTEGTKLVKELLRTNGHCELPCWWGIRPGEPLSDAQISLIFQAPFHRITDTRIDFGFEYGKSRSSLDFDYSVGAAVFLTDGVISQVSVASSVLDAGTSAQFAQDWQPFALQRMLTRFGVPSDVRLAANEYIPEEGAPFLFQLTVIYADKGIAIQYNGFLQKRADKLMLCPALSHVTDINLQLTRQGNAAQLWDQLRKLTLMNIDYADPLQDRSALSLTDFYTTFRDAPDACFRPFKD